MPTYLCPPYPQNDGSPFWPSNCGCAACTELADLASGGAVRPSGSRIRVVTGDVSGGIEGSVLVAATNEITGRKHVELRSRRAADRKEVKDLLEHRSLAIIIDCARTVRTPYRTNAFTGWHWVTVAAGTLRRSDNTVKVEDPGTTFAGWKRWPVPLLLDAAEAVNGGYWIMEATATHDVARHVIARTPVRDEPTRDGRRVRRLDRGDQVHVKHSLSGGPWSSGSISFGWFKVRGGFIKGEALGLEVSR